MSHPASAAGEREPGIARIDARRQPMLKAVAAGLATLLALPAILMYRIQSGLLPSRRDEVFQGYSQLVALWPGLVGNFVRQAFYRATLRRCSSTCQISFGVHFATPEVEIGEHVYVGSRCLIAHARILDHTLLGSNVDILAGKRQHNIDRLDVPIGMQGGKYTIVTLGPDCWIGNGATVADNVGEQAVVAAGAVVVKPVAPRTIVGGNPAKVIAERAGAETTSNG
jgi:acetyltransferase-like isoleucine patch superfamily enzyme